MHLFAETALRTNTEAVTHDPHVNHLGRTNRGQAYVAVVGSQMLMQRDQLEEMIDAAQQKLESPLVADSTLTRTPIPRTSGQ